VRLHAAGEWSSVAMLMTSASLSMGDGSQALSATTVFSGTGGLNTISLGKGATVSGGAHAFDLNGTENRVLNDGIIKAGYDFDDEGHSAILSGGQSYIQNTNWIGSHNNYGIMLRDGGNTIQNGNVNVPSSAPTPTISGGYSAIGIEGGNNGINNVGLLTAGGPTIHFKSGQEGEQNFIHNMGRIFSSTGGNAILSQGAADDRVTNAGTMSNPALIKGNILLENGDDHLENHSHLYGFEYSGGIIGHVRMGAGDDTVGNYGDIRGDIHLGSGNDTLDSTFGRLYSLTSGPNLRPSHIYGDDGNDTIKGSDVDDIIHGGRDRDVLSGGSGRDAFVFDLSLAAGKIDVITDFNVAQDIIHLESDIFRAIHGVFTADHLCIGSAPKDSSDRVIYDPTTGALRYDADGSGTKTPSMQFAILTPGLTLKADNFLLL
jgi:Ca2+-binding RTX toxin-like protein